jgi:hypothetical protein
VATTTPRLGLRRPSPGDALWGSTGLNVTIDRLDAAACFTDVPGGSRLNFLETVASISLTSGHDVILGDTTGGSRNLTLPLAATVTGKAYYIIKKVAANQLNILCIGSDTVLGVGANVILVAPYQARVFLSTGGTTWIMMAGLG